MYSTLAGFCEPGESLEDCVAREVYEEAGIRVDDIRYFASQPWPFPQSLMVGYFARATTFDVRFGEEMDDVRWFTRDEVAALSVRLETRLPALDTIARRLIRAWLAATT
jgi:NAD+ diphosphatase